MADQKTNHDTRERILDVAELLFMTNGYEGTSMRVITSGAEVNLAAVNYHFGSKEALLREVFRRRLSWLNRERLHALDLLEAEAAGAPLKPSQILEAFFGTLLRIGEDSSLGGMTFLRLLGRTLTQPAEFIRTFFCQRVCGSNRPLQAGAVQRLARRSASRTRLAPAFHAWCHVLRDCRHGRSASAYRL